MHPDRSELDITDPDQVARYLGTYAPDLIVHAAAYTDTLKPDRDPAEAAKCFAVNVLGTRNLVAQAACPLIYISTESALEPYNFYILTKLQGEYEVQHYRHGYRIIRTSFRFDPFEYPKAPTDMLTIAGTADQIAEKLDRYLDEPVDNDLIYVGFPPRSVYELAVQTRPDVQALPRHRIYDRLPAMEGLQRVNVYG